MGFLLLMLRVCVNSALSGAAVAAFDEQRCRLSAY